MQRGKRDKERAFERSTCDKMHKRNQEPDDAQNSLLFRSQYALDALVFHLLWVVLWRNPGLYCWNRFFSDCWNANWSDFRNDDWGRLWICDRHGCAHLPQSHF